MIKIMVFTFFLTVVQILYGRSYVSNVAHRFIDDEYDRDEKVKIIQPQYTAMPLPRLSPSDLNQVNEFSIFDRAIPVVP